MREITIREALERAESVQPPETKLITLKLLPDGQWVALYFVDKEPEMSFGRACYPLLECPLFSDYELKEETL